MEANLIKDVITQTEANAPIGWRYEVPKHRGAKVQLLTIGGISVTGVWSGALGEYFLAWAPLLKRDKSREQEIMAEVSRKRLAYRTCRQ